MEYDFQKNESCISLQKEVPAYWRNLEWQEKNKISFSSGDEGDVGQVQELAVLHRRVDGPGGHDLHVRVP